jgi:hypothetical protein
MSNARYSIFSARAVFDVDNLTATEVRILAALGTYTNDEGWCYPNQTTLAERLRLTRQTISSAIKKLVEKGYVETEVRTAKGRGKVGYNYRVVLDVRRAAAEPKADAKPADIGEGRHRPTPTSAPADFGEDHDPCSAHADIAYKDLTIPTEQPQHTSPPQAGEGDELERKQREAYAAAEAAKKSAAKPRAKAARKPTPYTPEFEMIWLAWPKNRRANSDKRKAFERYLGGRERFGAEAIAKAARRYLSLPETMKESWKYCCLVEVFMNGKLEAAVEAALEDEAAAATQPINGADLREADRHRAAHSYHAATGKWPRGYKPPAQAALLS